MALKNNFKIDSITSGWPLRFYYIADSDRFQVYLGGRNPQTGEFDPEYEYLDEIDVSLDTRAEGRQLADQFELSGERPEEMEFVRT